MSIQQNQEILAKDIREKLRINYIEPRCLTATKNGVTLTNNGDGTCTLNGTATGDTYFEICKTRVKGKFKLTGTPRNHGSSLLYEAIDYRVDLGDGVVIEEDGSRYIKFTIVAYPGTYDNVLYKPMLTTDLDATYDDFVSNSASLSDRCIPKIFCFTVPITDYSSNYLRIEPGTNTFYGNPSWVGAMIVPPANNADYGGYVWVQYADAQGIGLRHTTLGSSFGDIYVKVVVITLPYE